MVSVIIFLITAIWLVIFTVDNALEYKIGFRYISWKFHHDILLKPFYLRWHSPKLGIRTFHDFNFNLLNKKYIHWFNTGVFTTFLICLYGYSLFFPPIFQFLKTNYLDGSGGGGGSSNSDNSNSEKNLDADHSSINSKTGSVDHATGLVVGIPGWNLPASHAILVFFALLISGMIHEFGHALASAREHVSIHGAGVFLTYIFPGAFVSISTIELANCDLLPRMRILCAGVWHNLILCITSALMVFSAPIFLKVGYYEGVCVVQSPDVLKGGLLPGDRIIQINQCRADQDLFGCLRKEGGSSHYMNRGYCVDKGNLTIDHQSCDICSRDGRKLCYRELGHFNRHLNLAPKYCLNVKESLGSEVCSENLKCWDSNSGSLDNDKVCMKIHPYSKFITIPETNERIEVVSNAKIIQVVVTRDHNSQPDIQNHKNNHQDDQRAFQKSLLEKYPSVIYFGLLDEFLQQLDTTEYCSRGWIWPAFLPDLILTMLKYVFAISGGLMVLNSLPVYSLDGYLILESLLDSMYGIPERVRKIVFSTITTTTTFLVGFNVLLSLIDYNSLI